MTLPSVISHYKKKVLLEQFRVAYSLLQQAHLKITADWGYTPNCYYWEKNPYGNLICSQRDENGKCTENLLADGSPIPKDYNGNYRECPDFFEAFTKTLQVVNKCDKKAFEKGCIPEYEGVDTVIMVNVPNLSEEEVYTATRACPNFIKTTLLNSCPAYALKNGMIIIRYSNSSAPIFLVDINGKAGPNKWGHDLFDFKIKSTTNHQLTLYPGGCNVTEKGGVSTSEMIKNMNRKYSDK